MTRQSRRATAALRLESLESRTLLSADAMGPLPAVANPASDTLLVRFSADTPAGVVRSDLAAVGAREVDSIPDGPTTVRLSPGVDPSQALRQLRTDPGLMYAEADATYQVKAVYPNNPDFSLQYGLNSANDVDIDAPEAWSVTTGNPATIVAILDTGIDANNPAFAGRLWVNPDPSGSDGFVGDVNGWNFVSGNANLYDDNLNPNGTIEGHGTHVAGILAATGNDGTGVAGVNWQARIMPVKVLDSNGTGQTDQIVQGIHYAVDHGARVINASFGGGPYSQAMADAINYAGAHNVVFVTAAGNDGTNSDVTPSYPGSYRLPNEITVAAVDSSGNLANYSEFGAHTVDIAAPGSGIYSTIPGGFASYSGTSMATPYVSGVVSLLVGVHPEFTAQQLVSQVLATAKPLPGLAGKVITGGIVDAGRALGVTGNSTNAAAAIPPVVAPTAGLVYISNPLGSGAARHPVVHRPAHKVVKPKSHPVVKPKIQHRVATVTAGVATGVGTRFDRVSQPAYSPAGAPRLQIDRTRHA